MKKNVGNTDTIIRIAIALLVGILIYTNVITGVLAIVAGIVSIILGITGIFGFCPLYVLLGIKTCKSRPTRRNR